MPELSPEELIGRLKAKQTDPARVPYTGPVQYVSHDSEDRALGLVLEAILARLQALEGGTATPPPAAPTLSNLTVTAA